MLLHIIIFATIFVALAAATTWIIFVRMVREGLKMGEIKEKD